MDLLFNCLRCTPPSLFSVSVGSSDSVTPNGNIVVLEDIDGWFNLYHACSKVAE